MKHAKPKTHSDLTVIYYTANHLDKTNPYFVANTRRILKESILDTPLISVSHQPMDFGENICVGDIGRSFKNVFMQILIGAKAAKTEYIAMAEDDVLYSPDYFHHRPKSDTISYEMNKYSFFTWSDPLVFSWRRRKIINSMVCNRELFIKAMEERFAKYPEYDNKYCGEPGRYDKHLGVTPVKTEEHYSAYPNVVFSHEHALGYITGGRPGPNKQLGNLRGDWLNPWGSVNDVMDLWRPPNSPNFRDNDLGGTHLPVLSRALSLSKGPVLEMGMGQYSTPLIDMMCAKEKRQILSYENDPKYYDKNRRYHSDYHRVEKIDNWNLADIDDTHWGVVLIDHKPAKRRHIDAIRLKDNADFIIMHDAEEELDRFYGYRRIPEHFKYIYRYKGCLSETLVASNTVDLSILEDI